MGKLLITKFKGINSSKAALQLQNGEAPFLQNFRGRPFDNLAKRRGVEPSSAQSGAVQGIFELEFDEVIIPMFVVDGTLIFYPSTASVTWPTPGPFPPFDPIDPDGNNIRGALLVEPLMRAIQERSLRAVGPQIGFPNRIFNSAGNKINGNTGQVPPTQDAGDYYAPYAGTLVDFPNNGFYQGDINFHDTAFGNPKGTRAAFLVNAVRTAIHNTAPLFYPDPEGLSVWAPYGDSDIGLPAAATTRTYRQTMEDLKYSINFLKTIQLVAGITEIQYRTGTGFGANAAIAKADGVADFNASSWSDGLSYILFQEEVYDDGTGSFIASMGVQRGKFTIDLTNFPGTTSYIYTTAVHHGSAPDSNPCPITPDSKLRRITSATNGTNFTSDYFGDPVVAFSAAAPDYLRDWTVGSDAFAWTDISPFINTV